MENKWTIIFLIYADFREQGSSLFRRELNSLFRDLENCKLNQESEILVIQNIIDPWKNDPEENDITRVLRVENSNQGKKNAFVEIYRTSTRYAVQKSRKLGEIFRKIHSNGFNDQSGNILTTKGDRYFMVTWDHGSAFGIFKRKEDKPKRESTKGFATVSIKDNDRKSTTILQKKVTRFNCIRKTNGRLVKKERIWESPVYNYYSKSNNKSLFGLDTQDENENTLHQILESKNASDVSLLKVDSSFFINVPRRIFSEDPDNTNLKNHETKDALQSKMDNSGLESLSFKLRNLNLKKFDILTNEELQRAIDFGFKNPDDETRGVDVLMMMNCTMMNMHTCYALRNSVRYLVAPQGSISEPGYNYSFLISKLNQSLKAVPIEPKALAKLCVFSSGYEYWKQREKHKEKIEQWAIMAVDLSKYEVFSKEINTLSQSLVNMIEKNNSDFFDIYLFTVRNLCARFDDVDTAYYFMIDLTHWLYELVKRFINDKIDSSEILQVYSNMLGFANENIIMERIGESVIAGNNLIKRRPRGLSVYFPDARFNNDDFDFFVDRSSPFQSVLLRDNPQWLNFLEMTFLK